MSKTNILLKRAVPYLLLLCFACWAYNPVNAQGYIDCTTIINPSWDFIDQGIATYKVKDGYTYLTFTHEGWPGEGNLLPVINGQSFQGERDIYIAIFDPNCVQLLGTYFGGSADEEMGSMEMDAEGNLVIVGTTYSTDFPTTDGTTVQGDNDIYLTKFTSDGTLVFSTLIGGTDRDESWELALEDKDIYLTGYTFSSDFPVTDGSSFSGENDVMVVKYDGQGVLQFSTLIGGSTSESSGSIATGNEGVFIIGTSNSTDFPTTDGSSVNANYDIFLTHYDTDGNLVFNTIFGGGAATDQVTEVFLEGDYVYLTGRTSNVDFPSTDGSVQSGGFDIYLRKYDLSGQLIYSTIVGGSLSDEPYDIFVQNEMVYMIALSRGSGFPVVNGMSHQADRDAAVLKFDPAGNILFSTHYGSYNNDFPGTMLVTPTEEIYFTVQTGASPPTTDGSFGEGLAYVKLNSDGSLCAATVVPANGVNLFTDPKNEMELSGDTLTVPYLVNSNGISTDGTISMYDKFFTSSLAVSRFVFCPAPTPITSDVLSPSTINVCSNGIIDQIIGEELIIDGGTFPPVYYQGVLGQQPDIELNYQWQVSTSAGGPWSDIPGILATLRNYTPPPTTTNTYYRRIAKTSECCDGTIVSTSNVVSVLVGGNSAPTAHAGGTFYTCPGNAITIGTSPAASGGTPAYTYSWDDGAYTIPQPSVSPTEPTVYTLTVTDANGCRQADQATVITYAADAGEDASVCDGAGTVIGGMALQGVTPLATGYSPIANEYSMRYAWSPGTGLSCTDCPNPVATPSSNTSYTLTVTIYQPDGSSCSTSDVVEVAVVAAPSTVDFAGVDRVLEFGNESTLGSASEAINSYSMASVTQSSTDAATASIANLSDGNFATGGHTLDGFNEDMIIDLGSSQLINQLDMAALAGQTGDDRLRVYFSNDASSWTYKTAYNDGLSDTELTTYHFSPTSVRYIRLRCFSSTSDVSISEFYATYSYSYIWTPGLYITASDLAETTFDAGNLEMPTVNPITYTVTANSSTCNFYDQVTVAVIEARAGEDRGCGPTVLGEADRTPNIDEEYSWAKITDPAITTGTGDLQGSTDILHATASESVGGDVGYELTVTYTLNGHTLSVKDTVIVRQGCNGITGCDIVSDDGGCPSFDLGIPAMRAVPSDGISENWTYSWTSNMGDVGLDSYNSQVVNLTDNVTRTYTVTMTNIFNPAVTCTHTQEANSASYAIPSVNALPLVTTCPGVAVNIGDPASNPGLTYSWTQGNVLNSASVSYPVATVNSTTNFQLSVTDNVTGCAVDTAIQVLVADAANAGPDIYVCDNSTVQLGANTNEAGYTYSWSPTGANWQNGSTQFDMRPEVLVTTSQQFTLTVTDTAGVCTTTDVVDVFVETLPSSFSLPDITYCPSQSTDLVLGNNTGTSSGTNQVPNGYTYIWYPADVSDHSIQNPTVNTPLPTTATTFEVHVMAPDGCTQIVSQTITPSISMPEVAVDQSICLGSSVSIGSIANPTAGTAYSWSPSANLDNAASPNPIYTPTTTGSTTFTVSKTSGGCTSTNEVTIYVENFGTTLLSAQTMCSGSSVAIGLEAQPGFAYEWVPATGLSDPYSANPVFSGAASTNFILNISNNTGCSAQIPTSVTVNAAPAITTDLSTLEVCLSGIPSIDLNPGISPAGTYTYQWNPATNLSNPFIANPTLFLPGIGTYEYELEIIDQTTGCSFFDTLTVIANNTCIEICDDGTDNDGNGLSDCEDCESCFNAGNCNDNDGDGINDECDLDDDNDGILDTNEFNPTVGVDSDGDGIDDAHDPDCDGSSVDQPGGDASSVFASNSIGGGGAVSSIGSDNTRAALNSVNDFLVLDMGVDLVAGTVIEIESRLTNNTGHQMGVEESTDGTNFSNMQTYSWSVTNTEELKLYTLTNIARYVRITLSNDGGSGALQIDHVAYLPYNASVCNGVIGNVQLDTDNDGTPNFLDADSDNDGCPDAIEGGDNFTFLDVDANDMLTGGVDANGIPLVAGTSGQTIGDSQDASVQDLTCTVEICDDGIDNDGDGLIDCADPDCDNSLTITTNATASNICVGENTTISASAIGGTAPYTYVWDNGLGNGISHNITPLTTTTYTVTVTSNGGCTSTAQISITVNYCAEDCTDGIDNDGDGLIDCDDPDCGLSLTATPTDASCGNNDGQLTINVSSGSGSYEYSIDNVNWQASNFFSGLPPGNETFYVRNTNGSCTTTVNTSIGEACEDCTDGIDNDGDGLIDCNDPDCVPATSLGADLSICNGGSASLTITISSGTAPFTYSWSNGAGNVDNQNVSPAITTTYTVTVTSLAGCTSTAQVTITVDTCPEDCTDGIDNDGDGLIDCDDPDCQAVGMPLAVDDVFNTCPGQGNYSGLVSLNDGNLQNPTFSILTPPSGGSISINDFGAFTYSPIDNQCRTVQFTYQVCNQVTGCCASANAIIQFGDSDAPVLQNIPADITISCDDEIPQPPAVAALDACPYITIEVVDTDDMGSSGTCGNYTITRTWTTTDICGNSASESQIITVVDQTKPEMFRVYTLENGQKLVAGNAQHTSQHWKYVKFPIHFDSPPLVFAQTTSENDAAAVSVQTRYISTTGFEMRLREEEAADNDHTGETVSWMALEAGDITGAVQLSAQLLNDVDHNFRQLDYATAFPSAPVFIGTVNGTVENDPVSVRTRSATASSIQLSLLEEQSDDSETSHNRESIAWLAMTEGVNLLDENGMHVAENGTVTTDENWTTVNLNHIYNKPVVIFGGISTNESQAATIRVRNVTQTSFEVRVQEWGYLDGNHSPEQLSYLVVEGNISSDNDFYCFNDNPYQIGIDLIAIDNCDGQVAFGHMEHENILSNGLQSIQTWTAVDDCGNVNMINRYDTCRVAAFQLNAMLSGALHNNGGSNMMRSDLLDQELIPMKEPYSDMEGFEHYGNGGNETTVSDILDSQGNNAISDWLFVECRSPLDSTRVLSTQSVLLWQDGTATDVGGKDIIYFWDLPEGDYKISIRHRNHLGLLTGNNWHLCSDNPPFIDFSDDNTSVWNDYSAGQFISEKRVMWAGDFNGDGQVIYQGPYNDVFFLFSRVLGDPDNEMNLANYISNGYHKEDFDLDGYTIYQGPGNDRSLVLYFTVLAHLENTSVLANYIVKDGIP